MKKLSVVSLLIVGLLIGSVTFVAAMKGQAGPKHKPHQHPDLLMMLDHFSDEIGLTEQQMLDAVKFGHEGFVPIIKMIEDLAKECKKPDWVVEKKDLSSVKKKLER